MDGTRDPDAEILGIAFRMILAGSVIPSFFASAMSLSRWARMKLRLKGIEYTVSGGCRDHVNGHRLEYLRISAGIVLGAMEAVEVFLRLLRHRHHGVHRWERYQSVGRKVEGKEELVP